MAVHAPVAAISEMPAVSDFEVFFSVWQHCTINHQNSSEFQIRRRLFHPVDFRDTLGSVLGGGGGIQKCSVKRQDVPSVVELVSFKYASRGYDGGQKFFEIY